MSREERDIEVLKQILEYCNCCIRLVARFGKDFNTFCNDEAYYSAVNFQVYQACEHCSHLSELFRDNHPEIPWDDILGMRIRFAHIYGKMDFDIIWNTVINNLPELAEFCKKVLAEQEEQS